MAALVAASVLLAFFLHFAFLIVLMRSIGDPVGRFPDRNALRLVAALYAANPALRPALLREAAAQGLSLREIPDDLVRACEAGRAGACPPGTLPPFAPRVRATPTTWLAVTGPPWLPSGHGPPGRLAALLLLVGLPTLALSLWASRRVTAPLRRLTEQAEQVDPRTTVAPLQVAGTTEIRLLAEAFNRLILRLTHYAADQRRMLAAISHDLRTPLTRLRLRAETVAEPALRDRLVRDTETMQLLIDRALDLLHARDRAAVPVQVDLAALLQTVADDLQDAGVALTVGELAPLQGMCEPLLLTSAVENLLQNAATHAGGGTLSLRAEDREAVIEVADRGPGLDEAERDLVLAPWYRGDASRRGPGHGLGLAIVHSVMTALGGKVEFAQAVPHGLIARLRLPLRPATAPPG